MENQSELVVNDLADSVAFTLLEDLVKSQELSRADADFLELKFAKLFQTLQASKQHEQSLIKKSKDLQNEIISEKILLEKTRMEESLESKELRRMEEQRNSLQKDLEFTEQRDTMVKFELTELKRVHDELTQELTNMKKENTNLVNPVISKLKQDLSEYSNLLKEADESFSKESAQKDLLNVRVTELEKVKQFKLTFLRSKLDQLKVAENEPGRVSRQVESIEKATSTMESENRSINRSIRNCDQDLEKQAKRRQDLEKAKKSLQEKMDQHRQTIEQREAEVAAVRSNLDVGRATNHDLVTTKVELNLRKKELDGEIRHQSDQFNLLKKEYENLKRQLKKKRNIVDSIKSILPQLEEQLKDQHVATGSYKEEFEQNIKLISKTKEELDAETVDFLSQEGIEEEKKAELSQAMLEVEELEADVLHWLAEGKRQGKLLAVLAAQRDIKSRECARIEQREKEAKQQVKVKELLILDLTKRCNEISNRIKEFSALYEVVKNERNKYVNLIQSSTQALAEMREKIRILHNEVEILGNESSAKDIAFAKEKSAHQQAQNQRDALRQDMNRLLSEYRSKQSTVEQQIQEIDKLNVVISSLEREMLLIKERFEKAVEERNITGVQLIDRNDELCILYERCNQQQEALVRGEREMSSKEDEMRLIRIQTEELKRQYDVASRRLPELSSNVLKVQELEKRLDAERKVAESLSSKLEDPQHKERWRSLEGEDPDTEQLTAKINVLEARLDQKREQLLEKELVLEEVTALTERLRLQAVSKRDNAKDMSDQLNELQRKIRDTTRKMLASVSELSMYQATALRLQQEKIQREKIMEESQWRFDHGEAPTEDTIKDWNNIERKRGMELERSMRREEELQLSQPSGMAKTSAEPRPTAYIPDDLGIPKPYGNSAPFKPMEPGASMRHIRVPVMKPIEI